MVNLRYKTPSHQLSLTEGVTGRDWTDMTIVPEAQSVIYGLSCACHEQAGVRYVGLTANRLRQRAWGHLGVARRGGKLPIHKWIRKHGEDNIVFGVLEECEPSELMEAEIRWIAALRAGGASLLNMTDGGPGMNGAIPDVRARMVETRKRYVRTPEHTANSGKAWHKSVAEGRRVPVGLGRHEDAGGAKLTEAQAIEILASPGNSDAQVLANKYGISRGSIYSLIRGTTWPHLDRSAMEPRVRTPRSMDVPPETRLEIIRLYAAGASRANIEKVTGFGATAIYRLTAPN